jgi:F-type H+-transporting ATPase subunit gamma
VDTDAHPLLEVREEIKTSAIVLITSDRGLCGSFNTNLIKRALKLAEQKAAEGKTVKFYCIGKKGRDAVAKSTFEMPLGLPDAMSHYDFTLANQVGMQVIDGYLSGELDEVTVVYGKFINMVKQDPVALDILPIEAGEAEEVEEDSGAEYIYEPEVEGLLAELLPRFIKVQIYRGLLDTSASEHAARMTAMYNATRACDDLVDSLTLVYNKTRQAVITTELMDIVSGAEALNG